MYLLSLTSSGTVRNLLTMAYYIPSTSHNGQLKDIRAYDNGSSWNQCCILNHAVTITHLTFPVPEEIFHPRLQSGLFRF